MLHWPPSPLPPSAPFDVPPPPLPTQALLETVSLKKYNLLRDRPDMEAARLQLGWAQRANPATQAPGLQVGRGLGLGRGGEGEGGGGPAGWEGRAAACIWLYFMYLPMSVCR